MSYPYTQANRLLESHSYMYTPFQGVELLQSYAYGRTAILQQLAMAGDESGGPDAGLEIPAVPLLERSLAAISPEAASGFRELALHGNQKVLSETPIGQHAMEELSNLLPRFSVEQQVTTLELLRSLIASMLLARHDAVAKNWLDLLVQRFEVTKKLYASYPAGFRKGEGSSMSVRLYWLFALALCLFYISSVQIKYLSTLLKVSDLLCSLPESELRGYLSSKGMAAILAAEVMCVQNLAATKGVSFATR